jgi:hypothetical protein
MGWINVALPALAALRFGSLEHPVLFWLSIVAATVGFWSRGVMHKVAFGSAAARRKRFVHDMRLEGRPEAEIAAVDSMPIRMLGVDAQQAPDWATLINMGATLLGYVLLVSSIFV